MTPDQLARLAALRERSRLARLLHRAEGLDWSAAWEEASLRVSVGNEEQPGNTSHRVAPGGSCAAALHFPTNPLDIPWRDTLSFDTYCGPCYLAHLRDGVIEDTFEPYYGPVDFCDACLEGFSG